MHGDRDSTYARTRAARRQEEGIRHVAGRKTFDTPPHPDRNYILIPRISTQRHNVYNTIPYFEGRVLRLARHHWCSRRHFGSPWVGPINLALKRFQLSTILPGATSTTCASSTSLFLCRVLGAFSSSLTHVVINKPATPTLRIYCFAPSPPRVNYSATVLP